MHRRRCSARRAPARGGMCGCRWLEASAALQSYLVLDDAMFPDAELAAAECAHGHVPGRGRPALRQHAQRRHVRAAGYRARV
ncbi:hypothetical protein ACTMU2_41335 [Cupriavidus basilensis]